MKDKKINPEFLEKLAGYSKADVDFLHDEAMKIFGNDLTPEQRSQANKNRIVDEIRKHSRTLR